MPRSSIYPWAIQTPSHVRFRLLGIRIFSVCLIADVILLVRTRMKQTVDKCQDSDPECQHLSELSARSKIQRTGNYTPHFPLRLLIVWAHLHKLDSALLKTLTLMPSWCIDYRRNGTPASGESHSTLPQSKLKLES